MNGKKKATSGLLRDRGAEKYDATLLDRRFNRVRSDLGMVPPLICREIGITRLESELSTVRAKMWTYLEELGL